MAVDSFSHSSPDVLNDLDPLSRALLDLSVQRGMDDAEIAQVLGTDEDSVFEVRVGLLRSLADKVAPEHAEAEVPELQAVIAERLYADDDETVEAPVDETTEQPAAIAGDEDGDDDHLFSSTGPQEDEVPTAVHAAPEPTEPREHAAEPRKRRSALVFLVPLLLLAAIAAGIFALASGGGDDDASPEPAAQQPAPAAASDEPKQPARENDAKPEPTPRRATRLNALGETGARGTASIEGDRLTLKLSGLASAQGGAHEVWLYDSIIDAKSLGSSKETKLELDAKLPANASGYEFVDVSLEPADGNRNHSGQSVLRVPVEKLR